MTEIILAIAIILAYFLPAIIASARNHKNSNAILMLNLLLGWTLVGWIAAIVWSATDNTVKEEVA